MRRTIRLKLLLLAAASMAALPLAADAAALQDAMSAQPTAPAEAAAPAQPMTPTQPMTPESAAPTPAMAPDSAAPPAAMSPAPEVDGKAVAIGDAVKDTKGEPVGTIDRLANGYATINTVNNNRARLPLTSFARRDGNLIIGMTAAEVDAAAKAASPPPAGA